jgi:nucleotide-binding universal stress UspA family protein
MYKTILAPLDGSKRAEKILPHVEALAQKFGATLVLMQVVDPAVTEAAPYDIVPNYDPEQAARLMDEAKAYLNKLKEQFQSKGIETKTVFESGSIVLSIIDVATREQADLIAIASHGRTGLARVFYGSVASGLLNRTDWPLLIIRAEN